MVEEPIEENIIETETIPESETPIEKADIKLKEIEEEIAVKTVDAIAARQAQEIGQTLPLWKEVSKLYPILKKARTDLKRATKKEQDIIKKITKKEAKALEKTSTLVQRNPGWFSLGELVAEKEILLNPEQMKEIQTLIDAENAQKSPIRKKEIEQTRNALINEITKEQLQTPLNETPSSLVNIMADPQHTIDLGDPLARKKIAEAQTAIIAGEADKIQTVLENEGENNLRAKALGTQKQIKKAVKHRIKVEKAKWSVSKRGRQYKKEKKEKKAAREKKTKPEKTKKEKKEKKEKSKKEKSKSK
jgi:hypothetical protein